MKNFFGFFKPFYFILLAYGFMFFSTARGQNYSIDQSLSRKEFETQVLKPKDEFWVVDFWASWCRPCVESMPELKELHAKYAGKPVRFISISWDENHAAWEAMLMRVQLPWQQIWVKDMQNATFLTKNFPHKFIPALFLVDRNGKVKKMADADRLAEVLHKHLDSN